MSLFRAIERIRRTLANHLEPVALQRNDVRELFEDWKRLEARDRARYEAENPEAARTRPLTVANAEKLLAVARQARDRADFKVQAGLDRTPETARELRYLTQLVEDCQAEMRR